MPRVKRRIYITPVDVSSLNNVPQVRRRIANIRRPILHFKANVSRCNLRIYITPLDLSSQANVSRCNLRIYITPLDLSSQANASRCNLRIYITPLDLSSQANDSRKQRITLLSYAFQSRRFRSSQRLFAIYISTRRLDVPSQDNFYDTPFENLIAIENPKYYHHVPSHRCSRS